MLLRPIAERADYRAGHGLASSRPGTSRGVGGGWRLAGVSFQFSVGSWQFSVFSFQLAVGSWQLAGGRWQVAGGRWQVAVEDFTSRLRGFAASREELRCCVPEILVWVWV